MYLLPKSSVPPFKPLIVILISSITSFFCFHSLSYANFLRYYSHDASSGHILSYYYLLFLLKFKNLILIWNQKKMYLFLIPNRSNINNSSFISIFSLPRFLSNIQFRSNLFICFSIVIILKIHHLPQFLACTVI